MEVIKMVSILSKNKSLRSAQQKGESYKKKDSDGLAGISKIIGQVGLGIIIGTTLYFSNAVTVEREIVSTPFATLQQGERLAKDTNVVTRTINGEERRYVKVKTPITTIPFVKNHEFNYSKLISWMGEGAEKYTWIIYILIVTFIITAVSNGANITGGVEVGDDDADGVCASVHQALGQHVGLVVHLIREGLDIGPCLCADVGVIVQCPGDRRDGHPCRLGDVPQRGRS